MSYFILCLLSPILLIILYHSNSQLSSSLYRILLEAQNSKGFLAFPNDSKQDHNVPQIQQEFSSIVVLEAVKEANSDDFLLTQRRLQQDEPVLTSTQLTTIRPPPGPGKPGKPVVVTTETYVQDVKNEEEIIIEVKDNQDPLEVIETIENGQPQITNGEDVFISSWWTFEDEEMAFENWEQLESFIGTQYGNEPAIGIDVNAEDVPVEVEIVVPKPPEAPNQTIIPNLGTQNINEDLNAGVINLTDIIQNSSAVDWGQYEQEAIEGVGVVYASIISTGTPKCKQVQTCQKVYVRPIGYRNVCKNQMVCPKA